MNTVVRRGLCIAGVFSALALSSQARAQSDQERAAARSAAQQGISAYQDGKYAQGAELLERAEALVHAPTHLLYLARSYEKLGKLVKARETYLKLSREELAPNSPKAFRAAMTDGAKELAALEPRIPYLTVVVKNADAKDARVLENDVAIPAALIGIARPADPGPIAFSASAPGFKARTARIELKEGERQTVEFALEKDPSAAAVVPPAKDAPISPVLGGNDEIKPPPETPPADSGGPDSTLRTLSYVSFGVAAIGVGAGTYFLIQSGQSSNESDDLFAACNPRVCTPDERDEINAADDDADKQRRFAIIGFAAGGVGLAAGITLFVLSSGSASETAGVTPWIGPQSAGIAGRF